MQITSRQEFPATPDAVHAMITDEAFLTHAAAAMGASDARVAATASATAVEGNVASPAELRPFIGATVAIRQETTWGDAGPAGGRDGTIAITVPGTPVRLVGTARLEPAASGAVITYTGDLTVGVPVLGDHIERQAAPVILAALDTQADVGRQWLTP